MSGTNSDNKEILRAGLWRDNPALVMLLGLCPLLAVSNSAINGLALGLATLLTVCLTNTLVSFFRYKIESAVRIPIYVLIIATTVTSIEFLAQAYFPAIHQSLGIFLPLIVTNCLILGRAEAFASRNGVLPAFIDGFSMGMGFLWVLLILGGLRELLGQGTLFANAHLLFNLSEPQSGMRLFPEERGLLLALLPPGAFIGLGLLIAFKNWIDAAIQHSRQGSQSISTSIDKKNIISPDS